MNAQLVESVRIFLRGASNKVTAKVIADELQASPIEVGKALDELKGLRHADRDGLNRWHITERGRLGTPPDPPPAPARKKRNAFLPDSGKTKIQRILEAIGDDCLTVPEIAERTGIPEDVVGQNIHVSGKKYSLITDGKRGRYALWRRANPSAAETTAEPAAKDADEGVAEPDSAAIAQHHDEQEAASAKAQTAITARADEFSLETLRRLEEVERHAARITAMDTISRAELLDQSPNVQDLIADICDEIKALLLDKNRKYGNSALQPMRVFSKADPIEQINVRLDDKLSRLLSAQADDQEDAEFDLLGYLVLKRVAKRLPR